MRLRQLSPNRPDPLALPQRLNASLCQEQATAGNGVLRLRPLSFISTASAAESFRSRCGSVRGAPELSSQTSPVAAPQVGQRRDTICFEVSSLVFMTA